MLIVTIAIAAFIVFGFALFAVGAWIFLFDAHPDERSALAAVIGLAIAAVSTGALHETIGPSKLCRLAPASLVLPAEAP